MQQVLAHPILFAWLICSLVVFFGIFKRGYGLPVAIFCWVICPIICAIEIYDYCNLCKIRIEKRNTEKEIEKRIRPA